MAHSVYFCNYSIGPECYKNIEEICKPFGKRIFLIYGEHAYAAAGALLEDAIADTDLSIVDRQIFGEDCTMNGIEHLAAIAKKVNADMIFGLGGGKAIDTAKGAADTVGLPVFAFPTIASTCAATTKLSVVYREDHSFEKFLYYDRPARHCFINTQVIADAPDRYLRAGMGDTIGKYFECQFAARNDDLEHSSALGHEISRLCWYPLLKHGRQALYDCQNGQATDALEEAILAIIVSTGLVSLLVLDEYNGAIAHSVYYALCLLPGFEENNLHGDVVGYGVMVQQAIDGESFAGVRDFLLSLGIAVTLKDMGVSIERTGLEEVLKEVIAGPDMEHIPYPVTKDMVYEAMVAVENY